MAQTRGQLIDRVAAILGDSSTNFRTYMESSIDQMLFALWDRHDWEFKHQAGSFYTVANTEAYNLSNIKRIYHGAKTGGAYTVGETITGGTSGATGTIISVGPAFVLYTAVSGTFVTAEVITGGTSTSSATTLSAPEGGVLTTGNIRSAQDLEVVYDKTNGRMLYKIDLRDIRKHYPKEDQVGQPLMYAPWESKTIYLTPNPDAVYQIKFLALVKPTLPTADANDLESVCGLPDYVQYLFEKMVLAEAYLYYDDNRRVAMLNEINTIWLPNAIQADMKHLESGARFKFWEEELAATGGTFDDFLRNAWATAGN